MVDKFIVAYFQNKREKFFKLIKKYYPNYISQFSLFADFANDCIAPLNTLVDAGCGRQESLIRGKSKAKLSVGIDLTSEIKKNKSIDVAVLGCIEILPFKNDSIDVLVSQYVIEHLKYPKMFFQEAKRVLKPKGRLVFMTPNRLGYRTILSIIIPNRFHNKIIKFRDRRDEDDIFPTYYKANTIHTIKKTLRKCGFVEDKIIMFEGYPPLPFSLILTIIMILYERLVNKFESLKLFRSVIIASFIKS